MPRAKSATTSVANAALLDASVKNPSLATSVTWTGTLPAILRWKSMDGTGMRLNPARSTFTNAMAPMKMGMGSLNRPGAVPSASERPMNAAAKARFVAGPAALILTCCRALTLPETTTAPGIAIIKPTEAVRNPTRRPNGECRYSATAPDRWAIALCASSCRKNAVKTATKEPVMMSRTRGRTTDAEVGHEVQHATDVGDRKCEGHHRHADPDLRGLDTAESPRIVLDGHDARVGGHARRRIGYI